MAELLAAEQPPNLLQIFRESLKPGSEAAYQTIEDEIARLCVELKCPHPHVAMEPLAGPKEVWWLNAFESDAARQRVVDAYVQNGPLMAALDRSSRLKAAVTATPIDVLARYRPDLSRGAGWTLRGARFVVVAISDHDLTASAAVFEAPDGTRYILKPVDTREKADAVARRLAPGATVFAVLPRWGLPAKDWVEADPGFWSTNPLVARNR